MSIRWLVDDWVSNETKALRQKVTVGCGIGAVLLVIAYHLLINKGLVVIGLAIGAVGISLLVMGPSIVDSKTRELSAEEAICADQVLVDIANSRDVPDDVKAFLADHVASNQQITNGLLYQIDNELAVQRQIRHSQGHQELLKHRDNANG